MLSFRGGTFHAVVRQKLAESPVEDHTGRQRRGILIGPSKPAEDPLGDPEAGQVSITRRNRAENETKKPRTLMNCPTSLKWSKFVIKGRMDWPIMANPLRASLISCRIGS